MTVKCPTSSPHQRPSSHRSADPHQRPSHQVPHLPSPCRQTSVPPPATVSEPTMQSPHTYKVGLFTEAPRTDHTDRAGILGPKPSESHRSRPNSHEPSRTESNRERTNRPVTAPSRPTTPDPRLRRPSPVHCLRGPTTPHEVTSDIPKAQATKCPTSDNVRDKSIGQGLSLSGS
jgi:hypothetical protein